MSHGGDGMIFSPQYLAVNGLITYDSRGIFDGVDDFFPAKRNRRKSVPVVTDPARIPAGSMVNHSWKG